MTFCQSVIKHSCYDFIDLKKIYPALEKGDWILERQAHAKYNFWTLYRPCSPQAYQRQYVSLSADPKNIFYFENQLAKPLIIKSTDKLLEVVQQQLMLLASKPPLADAINTGPGLSPVSLETLSEKPWSATVMQYIRPFFLSAYSAGRRRDRVSRRIEGIEYTVERYNHGLAHGMRQGALAKDIFDLLCHLKNPVSPPTISTEMDCLCQWANTKKREDPYFIKKLELAAAFQRSGRQSEVSSTVNPTLYKYYERQDALNFRAAAEEGSLFNHALEIQIFEEAILWSNSGILVEEKYTDLKFLRRILHAAHTLDLRRILGFSGKRIQQDVLDQLLGSQVSSKVREDFIPILQLLWDRCGAYLKATGERDLVTQRSLQDIFFLQSHHPSTMIEAIGKIRKKPWL